MNKIKIAFKSSIEQMNEAICCYLLIYSWVRIGIQKVSPYHTLS